MRNYLLSLLVALLAVTGSLPLAAQKAYAVLTPDDGTLTFYYDNQRATRRDYQHIYDMPKPEQEPAWAGDYFNRQRSIKHVVFDASFSEYRPISTKSWFAYCVNLQDIEGIRNLNTEKVTDMAYMFRNCEILTSLDVSNFNTQNVTQMWMMFSGCKALTSLDVSNFNTKNVTGMSWMFYGCTSLTTIYCNSNWKVGQNVDGQHMFYDCRQLKGTNTAFDENKTGIEMANPTTGYFTAKTTGIDPVTVADKVGDGKIYDLSGRQVNKNYKGVVVTNGRKILQR